MEDAQELEGMLMASGREYDSHEGGTWLVREESDHVENIVIQFTPPVVLFRVKLMGIPKDAEARARLFEKLLRLNAMDMVAGAYGLEGDAVILTETLQTENLDQSELQAALDGLSLAVSAHYAPLSEFLTP